MDETRPELIDIDGKPYWRFLTGETLPYVAGGADAEDDEEDDPDEEDEQDPDEEDDEGDGSEDEDDGSEEEDDGEDDEDDEELDDETLSEIVDAVVDRLESTIDRRIRRLTRTLDRKYGDGDRSGKRRSGGRSRRDDDDEGDDFSVREARLVGRDAIRDDLPRLSTEEQQIVRDMLDAEIAKRSKSGDDEDTVGAEAAKAVVRKYKALTGGASKRTTRRLKKTGAVTSPAKQRAGGKGGRKPSTQSQMRRGAERAARFNPSSDKKE